MESEVIDMVDAVGKVIGQTTRNEAYKRGLLHMAVNIIVFNRRGEIYLQRRSKNKSAFPLYWDISASEHLKSGESYKKAAIRGLKEELGINITKINLRRPNHIQKSKYLKNGVLIKEYELVELYTCKFDGEIKIDPEEVEDGKFFNLEDLSRFNKNNFTPWGLDEIKFLEKVL